VSQWKPLAGGLDPAVRRLVISLRTVKDAAGVSTTALAAKTPYSRSAWDRYLNGRVFPPRDAVSALAQLAAGDETRLLAEWELAAAARTAAGSGSVGQAAIATEAAEPAGDGRGRGRRWGLVAAGTVVVVAAITLGVVWVSGGRSAQSAVSAPAGPAPSHDLECRYGRTRGLLYAGHSTTSDRLVALNGAGEDVVEVQCLLKERGFDPGRVDGLFGPHTEAAVKQFQQSTRAVVDGIVGAQTWSLLRR
jgi:hypothetical protein